MERWNLRLPRRSHHFVLGVASWVRSWGFWLRTGHINSYCSHHSCDSYCLSRWTGRGGGFMCLCVFCTITLYCTCTLYSTLLPYSMYTSLSLPQTPHTQPCTILHCDCACLLSVLSSLCSVLFCTILSSILYHPLLCPILSPPSPIPCQRRARERKPDNKTELTIGRRDANPHLIIIPLALSNHTEPSSTSHQPPPIQNQNINLTHSHKYFPFPSSTRRKSLSPSPSLSY